MIDFSSPDMRHAIITETKGEENMRRKEESLMQYEIFKDRTEPFVKEYLEGFYQAATIDTLPIVSSINIGRRIVKQEAGIYKRAPKRTFTNASDELTKKLEELYNAMGVNQKMKKANEFFKVQDQNHLNVILTKGKLKLRVLLGHHIDAIPDSMDPETAEAYLVSGYDRSFYLPRLKPYEDGMNQKIADPDDYQAEMKRISVWTNELNFVMDEKGAIVSGPDVTNPLGLMPFVDVSVDKDSEYFVRSGSAITDFTVQWNGSATDLGQIVRMQSYGQAWFKGSNEMIPQTLTVGPNIVLRLPIDPERPTETDFGFASPNADIAGSIQYLEVLLSSFLSSRGVDPKTVNTKGDSKSFSSGLERLLSMIESFEPSKEDFDVFKKAEADLFQVIKAYVNTYDGTEFLQLGIGKIPDNVKCEVKFTEPQSVMSDTERLDVIERKRDMRLITQVEAVMIDRDLPKEQAELIVAEINAEEEMEMPEQPAQPEAEEVV